jgi:uncharacterized membrane protein
MDYSIFLFSLIVLILDIPFITFFVGPQYKSIDLGLKINVVYALLAYIVMGLSWFLIDKNPMRAAFVGFVIYGVYAFTLAAILPSYSITTAFTEVIWGTFLFYLATIITNKIITTYKVV